MSLGEKLSPEAQEMVLYGKEGQDIADLLQSEGREDHSRAALRRHYSDVESAF